MLRVLVPTEVREHSARSVLGFHVGGNPANDVHDGREQMIGGIAEIGERRHMSLRHDDDVYRPERPRVPERQDLIGLDHDVDGVRPLIASSQ